MDEVTEAPPGAAPVASGTLARRAAVAELLRDPGDLLVVTGLGSPAWDAAAAGDRDTNFYLWAAMGSAAMVGLGLALAQPRRPLLVLTGDGDQLMGLGALATIGVKRPKNLTIAVLDNGHYGETGMQQSHSAFGVRLDGVARACNFDQVEVIGDMAGVSRLRALIHAPGHGPRFARLLVRTEKLETVLPPNDGVFLKNRFRAALGHAPD